MAAGNNHVVLLRRTARCARWRLVGLALLLAVVVAVVAIPVIVPCGMIAALPSLPIGIYHSHWSDEGLSLELSGRATYGNAYTGAGDVTSHRAFCGYYGVWDGSVVLARVCDLTWLHGFQQSEVSTLEAEPNLGQGPYTIVRGVGREYLVPAGSEVAFCNEVESGFIPLVYQADDMTLWSGVREAFDRVTCSMLPSSWTPLNPMIPARGRVQSVRGRVAAIALDRKMVVQPGRNLFIVTEGRLSGTPLTVWYQHHGLVVACAPKADRWSSGSNDLPVVGDLVSSFLESSESASLGGIPTDGARLFFDKRSERMPASTDEPIKARKTGRTSPPN